MKHLLDVNVVVSLLLAVHPHHDRARSWLLSLRGDTLLLTPWVEIGFLRVGLHTRLLPDLATGQKLLQGFPTAAARLVRIADNSRAAALPSWVLTAAHLGDGHLSALAATQGARLTTFDQGIPEAYLIP